MNAVVLVNKTLSQVSLIGAGSELAGGEAWGFDDQDGCDLLVEQLQGTLLDLGHPVYVTVVE